MNNPNAHKHSRDPPRFTCPKHQPRPPGVPETGYFQVKKGRNPVFSPSGIPKESWTPAFAGETDRGRISGILVDSRHPPAEPKVSDHVHSTRVSKAY